MTDIEMRLKANIGSSTNEIRNFRKEYVEMARALEKPLRQIDALEKTQASAKTASAAYFEARRRVDELKRSIEQAGQPVRDLDRAYAQAQRTLATTTREFDRQKAKVREQRAELKAAGVDTRNLASEQRRLQAELSKVSAGGRNSQALQTATNDLGVGRYRALQAELIKLQQQYKILRSSGTLTARELAIAQQTYTQRIRETNQALRENAAARVGAGAGVGSTIGGVLGGIGLLEGARAYVSATDLAKKMEAQLRLATETQKEFNRAQAETYRIAQENQAPLEDVVTLYSRLTPALREVGRGQDDALKIIEAVTKSLRISGATAQETASTIQQFSQALGSGVLRGEEFNTLAESSPRLLRALADGLNTNVGALRQMAAEGQLTADVISNALIGQLPKLAKEAAQLPDTFSGAATKFKNDLVAAITVLDRLTGASESAIGSLGRLSGALSAASKAEAPPVLDRFNETFRLLRNSDFQSKAFSFLLFGFDDAKEQAALVEEAVEAVKGARQEDLSDYATYISSLETLRQTEVKSASDAIKVRTKAERDALNELEKARRAQLDTEIRYKEALDRVRTGASGSASFGDAMALRASARQALEANDFEQAKRNAEAALRMLVELADAGENTYGFEGFIKSLKDIEDQADKVNLDQAKSSFEQAQQQTANLKELLDGLKNTTITLTMDQDALAQVYTQLQELMTLTGRPIELTPPSTSLATGPAGSAPRTGSTIPTSSGSAGTVTGARASAGLPTQPSSEGAEVRPASIRQDGGNSWTNLPPVEVAVSPQGIRQDGPSSWTNLPPVEVSVAPRGIRQDGENSFTNLPPVDIELQVDQEAASVAQQQLAELAQQLKRQLVIPITPMAGPAGAIPAGQVDGYASGGLIRGPGSATSDSILARLSNGEFVMRADAVKHYGAALLQQINTRQLPKFATGGLVSSALQPSVPPMAQLVEAKANAPQGMNLADYGRLGLDIGGGRDYEVLVHHSVADDLRLTARKFGRTHRR
ncbi:tape measure protein [Pseudomonas sp.]|uniref:tape measure protein n=1 Tax=Pseudomonas sp. TaxID=306 RepID=UPI003D0A9C63